MAYIKYHKIQTLGHEDNVDIFAKKSDPIIIEEKIDGANFRIFLKKSKVIFGSRSQVLMGGLETGKNWLRCISYLNDKFDNAFGTTFTANKNIIIYGECCVKHTMDYNWTKIPPYLGFDIGTPTTDGNIVYMDYKEKKDIFDDLDIPMVPLIWKGTAGKRPDITDEWIPVSKFSEAMKCEGIVIKNYKRQLFAKVVRDAFKEKNKEVFGKPKKHSLDDNERMIAVYCTNARIEKMIFKMVDEDHKLEMAMMKYLPRRVQQDIWEECWSEISATQWSINFRSLRQLISKRCGAVLKMIMVNNALASK